MGGRRKEFLERGKGGKSFAGDILVPGDMIGTWKVADFSDEDLI